MTFVYVYLDAPAQGDELRWSIRSVERFCRDECKILVVGDRPSWYRGPHLPVERIRHRYRDSFNKLLAGARSDQVGEEFVWMMDDIYFTRPFSLAELRIPRSARRMTAGKCKAWNPKGWQAMKKRTACLLFDLGYDHAWDYATHLPHVLTRDGIENLLAKFPGIVHGRELWEILYGALHWEKPLPLRDTLLYLSQRITSTKAIELHVGRRWVLNNSTGAWGPGLREYLYGLLPDPSPYETDQVIVARASGQLQLTGNRRIDVRAKMLAGLDIFEELAPRPSPTDWLDCEYRGAATKEVFGTICPKDQAHSVFPCKLFGQCTLKKTGLPDLRNCNGCDMTLRRLGLEV